MTKTKPNLEPTAGTDVVPVPDPAPAPAPPTVQIQTIERTLEEREKTHGDFRDVSHYAQLMKDIFRASKGFPRMNDAQREAVEAWLCKTARLMAGGDVSFPDHAHDVAGYARLYVLACAPQPDAPMAEPAADPAPADVIDEMFRTYAPEEFDAALIEQAAKEREQGDAS